MGTYISEDSEFLYLREDIKPIQSVFKDLLEIHLRMGRSSKPVVALLPHALVQIKRFQGKDEPSGMYFRRLRFDVNFSSNS